MLSSIAGIRSNTGTPSSIEIRGGGVVSTQPTNVPEAVGDVELPVHSLEDRTAGCFERCFYCEDAWKKKAIKGCVNEFTLGCGYVTCFVVSVASSIQSASNPAWVPLAAVSGLSAGRFLCWLPDRNYVNVRTYLGTECCGLPPDAFPRY